MHPAGDEDVIGEADPADAGPAAEAGVEDYGVEVWDLEGLVEVVEVDGAFDELLCGVVNCGEVAQVELDGGDVDAVEGAGGEVADATRAQGLVRGGGAKKVRAQVGDGLGGFAGGAGGGEDDEVGGQGVVGEEGVDEALTDTEANATGGGGELGQYGACAVWRGGRSLPVGASDEDALDVSR